MEDRWMVKNHVKVNDNWYCVSTTQLTFKHYGGMWFETMIFGSDGKEINDWSDRYMERYKTLEAAQEGHRAIVERLGKGELELSEPLEALMSSEGFAEDLSTFFIEGISKLK